MTYEMLHLPKFHCPICEKPKNKGNHRKCSKKLQAKYAPDTELGKLRAEELAARKLYLESNKLSITRQVTKLF